MRRTKPDEAENSPTAWFALLERARQTGRPDLEQRAMEELRRLGVEVRFFDLPTEGTVTR